MAKRLSIGPSNVTYYIKQLEKQQFIKPLEEHANPKIYIKGPRANVLDKALFKMQFQIDGGSVSHRSNSNSEPTESEKPVEMTIPDARTNPNGSVIFPVIKLGDLNRFKVRKDGQEAIIELFPAEPYLKNNNAEAYKCTINYNGGEASLVYWHGAKKQTLMVWPPAQRLIPERFEDAERMIVMEAQDIANFLSKYAGWQFGLATFKGGVEFAFDELDWLKVIPESVRTARNATGDVWMDRSNGTLELETNNPGKGQQIANLIVELPNTISKLEEGQIIQSSRVYRVEMTIDKILEIIDKLTLLAEKDAELKTKIMESTVMATAERVVHQKEAQGTQAAASSEYDGVMYQ